MALQHKGDLTGWFVVRFDIRYNTRVENVKMQMDDLGNKFSTPGILGKFWGKIPVFDFT
jgi:hypothetical protein